MHTSTVVLDYRALSLSGGGPHILQGATNLLRRSAESKPLRVLLIGAGKFGSMFKTPAERVIFFESVERGFALQARVTALLTGLSGLYLVHRLDPWQRFAHIEYWWMHAMVLDRKTRSYGCAGTMPIWRCCQSRLVRRPCFRQRTFGDCPADPLSILIYFVVAMSVMR